MNVFSKAMRSVRNSEIPAVQTCYKWYANVRVFLHRYSDLLYIPVFRCLLFLPKKKKVIASSFRGRKFGDNPQPIFEELHKLDPELDLVWIMDDRYSYDAPEWVRIISRQHMFQKVYEYATAAVWIDTHRLERYIRKSSKQLFIETWHGGLGIKKLDADVPKFRKNLWVMYEVGRTSRAANLYISNSDHLTRIYRHAFLYKGKIWKCGYPKNDVLINGKPGCKEKACAMYQIDPNSRLLVYAPTFRDSFNEIGFQKEIYALDFGELQKTVEASWGGKWTILLRWHPFMANEMKEHGQMYGDKVIDVTDYPDMQELILAADAFISDYSSCIFDAAIRNIPCFTFATDFEEYKADRGVYYEMEELPFPYAKNNQELMENIRTFSYDTYLKKWQAFQVRTGLHETGHAARDIAYVIDEYIKGNKKPLEEIQSEP